MGSIDTELAGRIRKDIFLGYFPTDERLSEARLCDIYQVSRTPVRLALRTLEREGIILRGEGRGYFVHQVTVADILQAVQVRGHLESLGARLMAQSPGRHSILPTLEAVIDEIDRLISLKRFEDEERRRLQQQNAQFHKTILDNCGNNFVGYTCGRISHLPMLEVGSMVFDRQVLSTPDGVEKTMFRLHLGNSQHKVIYEAIQRGDAVRAEGVMREHANTMVEYIERFEKREGELTISELVSYSGGEPIKAGRST